MLKKRFSPALLALLVTIAASGSVYAADITSEAPAIETPVSVTETVVTGGQAQTPATETPAVETPVVETPAAETPAAETPAVETPAAETPAVETPAAETPAVETPAAVEAPAAATLTITHRLIVGDQHLDSTETLEGFQVGQTVDLTEYLAPIDWAECVTSEKTVSLDQPETSVVLEYNVKPDSDMSISIQGDSLAITPIQTIDSASEDNLE